MTDTQSQKLSNLSGSVDQVDYDVLDGVKNEFITAAKSTLDFASEFGAVPAKGLGASANIFNLSLGQFLTSDTNQLGISLISEGLGTADDARPDDLLESEEIEFWHNIGLKTMSCLTNDAASSGLQSILLSLYLPSSSPEQVFTSAFMKGFTAGVVKGCREVGCVYLSGETPQLKTKIVPGKIDIAGAVMAVALPNQLPISGDALAPGDKIVFIASSGPHENGFTPLREMVSRLAGGYRTSLPTGKELWRAFNAPSKLYTPLVRKIIESGIIPTGLENISGHGWQKIMRSKKTLTYRINQTLPYLEVFEFVERQLGCTRKEMCEIFNCGVGFVVFVPKAEEADQVVRIAHNLGYQACHAGVVEEGAQRSVIVEPWGIELGSENFVLGK
jgi:phosphoribosylformylglycinamidine cyclo-ligase